MYIRRKVFSILENEAGEQRYFSTTDYTYESAEQREFAARMTQDDVDNLKKNEGLRHFS